MNSNRFHAIVFFSLLLGGFQSVRGQRPEIATTDWPWWRGQQQDGIAPTNQMPPESWSETENIRWRSPVSGRGHGSPTVVGDQVLLATADPEQEIQSVLSFDRKSGEQRWKRVVHEGGFANQGKRKANEKASLASSSVASDGKRLYINFLNDNAVWTTALDLEGNVVWQQKVSDYVLHQGFGSSPAIYGPLVIVSADNKGGGAIVGLNRESGEVVWRRDRPAKPNYASPIIVSADGQDQLILTGCDLVTSLNPLTGEELWEIEGATTECVTSTVSDGKHIFTSGGYPKNHISAVVADGSGKIAWEANTRAYVPSLLQRGGFLFTTLDAGIAVCLRCDTGEEIWKARLGGTFSSSPVMVGDHIYATNEEGMTFVFKANPESFEKIAQNQLGESVFATPAICDGAIYTRVAHLEDGRRQEYLYCIGD
ncbi:MAG: PQQ-binding-like beta-propeller repeat protein [Rubripirellula sp.]